MSTLKTQRAYCVELAPTVVEKEKSVTYELNSLKNIHIVAVNVSGKSK